MILVVIFSYCFNSLHEFIPSAGKFVEAFAASVREPVIFSGRAGQRFFPTVLEQ
jgi:hypothetical protein